MQPGAAQMGVIRRFFEAHGFARLLPAQAMLDRMQEGAGHQRAASSGGVFIAYSPLGHPVLVRTSRMGPGRLRATWFDPRTGSRIEVGTV